MADYRIIANGSETDELISHRSTKMDRFDELKTYIRNVHDAEKMEIRDLRNLIDVIENGMKQELKQNKPKLGNPATVGLAGFGVTTMILQFHNIGWLASTGPVIWLGVFFGGLAQAIAGLQEFSSGNNFGYSAFTTYGCFWMSFAFMMISHNLNLLQVTKVDIGYFLIVFTVYTGIMMIAASRLSLVLMLVFITLFAGFVALDVSHLTPCSHLIVGATNTTDPQILADCKEYIEGVDVIAGWILLLSACLALYLMAHLIYKDAFKKDVLPIGPPPGELLEDWMRQKFGNAQQEDPFKA